jgi:hypothetical protein
MPALSTPWSPRSRGCEPAASRRAQAPLVLTNEAAAGSSAIALMAKAGHTDMKVTRQYLHLAGIVFQDEAAALERRLLGPSEPAVEMLEGLADSG